MTEYVRHDDDDSIERLGFSREAVSKIFLWSAPDGPLPRVVSGAPGGARTFIEREYRAAGFTYDAISSGNVTCPDIWTGQTVAAARAITGRGTANLPHPTLPIFYLFRSSVGREFWLVIYNTYGRVTQILVPSANLVIYDLGPGAAAQICRSLRETLQDDGSPSEWKSSAPRVGLLDMTMNFGHQMINNLSGLQRLVDSGQHGSLDEIWIIGTEFFCSAERLFPEMQGKFRKWASSGAAVNDLVRSQARLFKIGSNIFSETLRQRIAQNCAERFVVVGNTSRRPLLAVTVRAGARRCVNLPQVVAAVFAGLVDEFPALGIVLDGWVVPDQDLRAESHVAAAVSVPHIRQLPSEIALATAIADRLPTWAVARNLIGLGMSESILGISDIDVYLSHVGTLQHKIGFFSSARGAVHGPRTQLASPESGSYSTETGVAPLFLPADAVIDLETESAGGPGYVDYAIVDYSEIVKFLSACLHERGW